MTNQPSIFNRFVWKIKRMTLAILLQTFGVLPLRWRLRLHEEMSHMIGIRSVVMNGENGAMEGNLHDVGFLHYLTDRRWSSELLLTIEKYMGTAAGTYIDIGANIGLTTVPLAAKHEAWTIHAFEPDPGNFELLQLNLLRNHVVDRVTAHNVALADIAGTLTLTRSPINFGDFRILRAPADDEQYGEKLWDSIEVTAQSLDVALANVKLPPPVIIKIDTQGAEPLILRGGRNVLSQASLVVMEFWPYGIARQGVDPLLFVDELKQCFSRLKILDPTSFAVLSTSFEALRELTLRAVTQKTTAYYDLVLSEPMMHVAEHPDLHRDGSLLGVGRSGVTEQ